MRTLIMVVALAACGPTEVAEMPDASPRPDAGPCPGETLYEPFSASAPLYGEACEVDGEGCRPNRQLPGGFAGVCVERQCRPFCGFYDNGSYASQCCLRGGREEFTSRGACVCIP